LLAGHWRGSVAWFDGTPAVVGLVGVEVAARLTVSAEATKDKKLFVGCVPGHCRIGPRAQWCGGGNLAPAAARARQVGPEVGERTTSAESAQNEHLAAIPGHTGLSARSWTVAGAGQDTPFPLRGRVGPQVAQITVIAANAAVEQHLLIRAIPDHRRVHARRGTARAAIAGAGAVWCQVAPFMVRGTE